MRPPEEREKHLRPARSPTDAGAPPLLVAATHARDDALPARSPAHRGELGEARSGEPESCRRSGPEARRGGLRRSSPGPVTAAGTRRTISTPCASRLNEIAT